MKSISTVDLCRLFLAGMYITASGGCGAPSAGKPTAHLSGTVTIGGQPLPDDVRATLQFKPTGPGQARTTSAEIAGGKYDAPHVPQGKVNLLFDIQQPTGRMIQEGRGTPFPEYRNLVPDKHGRGMILEVTEDNLQLDFDL